MTFTFFKPPRSAMLGGKTRKIFVGVNALVRVTRRLHMNAPNFGGITLAGASYLDGVNHAAGDN
jgi:hypothetical protein